MAGACTFPACLNPARTKGLCWGHYKQARRGHPLRPLLGPGGRRGTEPMVMLPGLAVSPRAATALDAKGPTRYAAAQEVIEKWAKRQK